MKESRALEIQVLLVEWMAAQSKDDSIFVLLIVKRTLRIFASSDIVDPELVIGSWDA